MVREFALGAAGAVLFVAASSAHVALEIKEAPVGAHSEKPEKFYEIVGAASYPPYGEAFQRKARPGFVNLFTKMQEAAE